LLPSLPRGQVRDLGFKLADSVVRGFKPGERFERVIRPAGIEAGGTIGMLFGGAQSLFGAPRALFGGLNPLRHQISLFPHSAVDRGLQSRVLVAEQADVVLQFVGCHDSSPSGAAAARAAEMKTAATCGTIAFPKPRSAPPLLLPVRFCFAAGQANSHPTGYPMSQRAKPGFNAPRFSVGASDPDGVCPWVADSAAACRSPPPDSVRPRSFFC